MIFDNKILVGCMSINKLETDSELDKFIQGAIQLGLNEFDHADIYGAGQCEEIFGKSIKRLGIDRNKIKIQSKCGIQKFEDGSTRFNFSKDYILKSVDGILARLNTDYLDSLLLHRPDALMEPDEVADAFDTLKRSGKVKTFGVSNQTPLMIELLQKSVDQKLEYNQIQMSLTHLPSIEQGLTFNTIFEEAVSRDNEIINYCRLHDITIQCWSPFQSGWFEGAFIDNPKYKDLNNELERQAKKYNTNKSAIAVEFLQRHPANMQVVTGTKSLKHLTDIKEADNITLDGDDWYRLYTAADHKII